MDYQTPLAKVRGLGAAHNGTGHWWMQRISSIVLIPLSFWLIIYSKHLLTATHPQITLWLAEPLNSVLAILWLIAVFYHAALGLQVVLEDYVQSQWQKITAIWTVKISFFSLGLTSILAILRIIF
jgi:succinate dehydrogenase / fumarate reductase membrane anchor subunit